MGRLISGLDLRNPPVGTIIERQPDHPPQPRQSDIGAFWPKLMLGIVIVIAPFYIMAAHHKDERRNALVSACEAKGYSHKECRNHYKNYKPLPER